MVIIEILLLCRLSPVLRNLPGPQCRARPRERRRRRPPGQFSRGFGRANLGQRRAFYLAWPEEKISQTLSGKSSNAIYSSTIGSISSSISILSAHLASPWSGYVRLLSVKRPEARSFYESEVHRLGWSVHQLDRQISIGVHVDLLSFRFSFAAPRNHQSVSIGQEFGMG